MGGEDAWRALSPSKTRRAVMGPFELHDDGWLLYCEALALEGVTRFGAGLSVLTERGEVYATPAGAASGWLRWWAL